MPEDGELDDEDASRRKAREPPRRTLQSISVEALVGALGLTMLVWSLCADESWAERHVTAARCIRDARTLSVGHFERCLAAVCAGLLLFGARPIVWRRVARDRLTVGAVLRNGFAVVLALLAVELYLRRPWAPPPILPTPPNCPFCPPAVGIDTTGYKLAASSKFTWHAGGRHFDYFTNAEGNRARAVESNADHSRDTIFVAGESIALGMGLPYEETFGAVIEDETGVQVVNAAVHGYALDQAYVHLSESMVGYLHPKVVVMLFVPEQAERAELEDRPRLRLGEDGGLTRVEATPEWIRDVRLRRLIRDAYHGDAEVDDMRAIVRATQFLARSKGAYMLVVTTNFAEPCQPVAGHRPWLFDELFDAQGVPTVHVDLPENQRVGTDEMHPGPRSHRQIADAVVTALRAAHAL